VLDTLKLMVLQMGEPPRSLIGFRNGVFDTTNRTFSPHRRDNWLRTVNSVDYSAPRPGENLADHAPHFYRWLTRAVGHNHDKHERILAALFMVLAKRYDWQMSLEGTGPGDSGKSAIYSIATLLASRDNTTSATIDTLSHCENAPAWWDFRRLFCPTRRGGAVTARGLRRLQAAMR